MTVRFPADEDLDFAIIEGLRSLEPAIDILDAKDAGMRGSKDPVVESLLLVWAASQAAEWRDDHVFALPLN